MLILTRRTGETVMIGDQITVTILGVKGNQVRVGINAPKTVPVHREEIYERIKRERLGEKPQPSKEPANEYVKEPAASERCEHNAYSSLCPECSTLR